MAQDNKDFLNANTHDGKTKNLIVPVCEKSQCLFFFFFFKVGFMTNVSLELKSLRLSCTPYQLSYPGNPAMFLLYENGFFPSFSEYLVNESLMLAPQWR